MSARDDASDERREALRPLASLIGKSEKAQRKLAPGTWQHAMLRDNLKALRLAVALLDPNADKPNDLAPAELQEALRALASMIDKTAKVQPKFAPGTSQHTLLRNRLQALRLAAATIRAALPKE